MTITIFLECWLHAYIETDSIKAWKHKGMIDSLNPNSKG